MLAAYSGRVDTVRMLIEKGADVDALNDNGQSPLAGAIFKGEAQVVEALAELKANPRLGRPTAIETAKIFHQQHVLTLLGASEEEINAPVPSEYTAPQTHGK